ncbi:hypothetical protein Y1Q_0011252 [Alligator mississippiensis]|uniref:Uncharacterized protein n=1 Tax=Alligator mississippiensis TaxID=8496 RepID=A0A151N7X4_ALLMI|nr:hypothetical protein Y1Q_0011252 [Alligator mississippiensis]
MLLGRDWAPVYDVLDRVRDTEVAHRRIRDCEGWLGETQEGEESADEASKLDLNNFTSCLQFREAQTEDPEIRELQERAQGPQDVPAPPPGGPPYFEYFSWHLEEKKDCSTEKENKTKTQPVYLLDDTYGVQSR